MIELKPGDKIMSVHSFNEFIVEYVSKDKQCLVANYEDKTKGGSRCFTRTDIEQNFVEVKK